MSMLIGDIVRTCAARAPRDLAATLGEEAVSFAVLDRRADRLTDALCRKGIRRGDVVAWQLGPALHTLAGMLACARIGSVFAPMSPQLSESETEAVLEYLHPRLLVCEGDLAAHGLAIDELEAAAGNGQADGPAPSDRGPHILYLTSGSTGRPKGVLVSHRASWLRSRPEPGELAVGAGGVLCTFPLYHYGGWHYVLEAWLRGVPVHLVAKADGPRIVEAIERHRPSAAYCIPAVWERVLAEDGTLGSIRFADTGTSVVSEELLAKLAERLPEARTRILYGATEAGRMAALEHRDLASHPGSVGRVVDSGRLEIANDGEILFSGPTLMNGYLDLAQETAEALRDGWYRTGDIGFLDEEGFLCITGRKREIIRTGGETVSPGEVESALGAVPGVRDLAIVGIPDPRWGEVVCAAVVPVDGIAPPTTDALRSQLSALAPHKHPRLVATVSEIPRTSATGQVMRAALRDAALDALQSAARGRLR